MRVGKTGFGAAGGIVQIPEAGIFQASQYSPQVALAIVKRVPFAPYHLNIRASFVDQTSTLNPVSFENGDTSATISQPSICDSIEYEVDAPNAFPGTQLKAQSDFFYALQSGIQARMDVQGAPRYSPAPFFTPIRSLMRSLGQTWPHGWVLQYNQTISMQFQQTIPVPTYPTNVIVTFRLWQPIGEDYAMMSANEARAQLSALGWNIGPMIGPGLEMQSTT